VAELQVKLAALDDPRKRQQALLAVAGRIAGLQQQLESEQQRLQVETDRLRAMVVQKQRYAALDGDIETQTRLVAERNPEYERYLAYREEAKALEARELAFAQTRTSLTKAQSEESEARHRLQRAEGRYDATRHAALRARCEELGREIASQTANHEHLKRDLASKEEQLAYLQRQDVKLQRARDDREGLERTQQALSFIRDTIKAAGPAITETLLRNISQVANDFFAEIMDDHAAELRWDRDYEVLVQRGADTRKFVQLSGGEQMSAALAVRLALLKEMSEVDVAFFDEPTQNMDEDRRSNLAGQIRKVRGFKQLIVISHDDTFEHDTDTLIRLEKIGGETKVSA
jgi:exonuclease SbcC